MNLSLPVLQEGEVTNLEVDPKELNADNDGDTLVVSINTDGIKVSVTTGSPNVITSYANKQLTVYTPVNEESAIRDTIYVSCGQLEAMIPLTIRGKECPTCHGTGKIKCPKCGGDGVLSYYMGEGGTTDFYGCPKCGGREGGEFIGRDGWPDYIAPRKGSGMITCPDCGGSGC